MTEVVPEEQKVRDLRAQRKRKRRKACAWWVSDDVIGIDFSQERPPKSKLVPNRRPRKPRKTSRATRPAHRSRRTRRSASRAGPDDDPGEAEPARGPRRSKPISGGARTGRESPSDASPPASGPESAPEREAG